MQPQRRLFSPPRSEARAGPRLVCEASHMAFDYGARRRRLAERMEAEGVVALFLPLSADLEYLSGVERQIPFFGQSSYAHGWASGGLFVPGADPLFVFPRMFVTFDLAEQPEGALVVVNESDDGRALFARALSAIPRS